MLRAWRRLPCRRPNVATRPAQHRFYTGDRPRPTHAPKPTLNLKHIRQNAELYKQTCLERNYESLAEHPARIAELHEEWLALYHSGQALHRRANILQAALTNQAPPRVPKRDRDGRQDAFKDEDEDEDEDETWRETENQVLEFDKLRIYNRATLRDLAKQVKTELIKLKQGEDVTRGCMEALAVELPNLTSDDTPRGPEPVVLRYINERPKLDQGDQDDGGESGEFPLATDNSNSGGYRNKISLSHVEIGLDLGILNFSSANKTTGWGWYYLVGAGAQLEQALIQYALSVVTRRNDGGGVDDSGVNGSGVGGGSGDWTQVAPPSIVYEHIGAACGFRPRDKNGEQQVYALQVTGGKKMLPSSALPSMTPEPSMAPSHVLAGTAEIPLASMHAMSMLDTADLPLKCVAVSRCYRAEAGARGAQSRGLYRVHEFTKVEMFAWTLPGRPPTKTAAAAAVVDDEAKAEAEAEVADEAASTADEAETEVEAEAEAATDEATSTTTTPIATADETKAAADEATSTTTTPVATDDDAKVEAKAEAADEAASTADEAASTADEAETKAEAADEATSTTTTPVATVDQAKAVFDEMVSLQVEILTGLGLPCRVLAMPVGDLGASAVKKIDIEAWFPSRATLISAGVAAGGWGEVTSASLCTDYQSRRLATRARPGGHAAGGGTLPSCSDSSKVVFPWTLNGTALAVPRVLAALLENGWDKEKKTVTIPECLRPWMGGRERIKSQPKPRKLKKKMGSR